MKGLKILYSILSLKLGDSTFQNKIDKSFFEAFNYSNPHDCNINVSELKKVHLIYVQLKYQGTTNIVWQMSQKNTSWYAGDFNSVLKFDHVEEITTKNEIIYLPYICEFNIAPVLYELFIEFSKKYSSKEKCNIEQLNLVLNTNSDSEITVIMIRSKMGSIKSIEEKNKSRKNLYIKLWHI